MLIRGCIRGSQLEGRDHLSPSLMPSALTFTDAKPKITQNEGAYALHSGRDAGAGFHFAATFAKHLNTYVLRRMLECRFAPFVFFCTRIHSTLFYFPISKTHSIQSHLSKTCAAVQILNDGVSLDSVERCPLASRVCPLDSCD